MSVTYKIDAMDMTIEEQRMIFDMVERVKKDKSEYFIDHIELKITHLEEVI